MAWAISPNRRSRRLSPSETSSNSPTMLRSGACFITSLDHRPRSSARYCSRCDRSLGNGEHLRHNHLDVFQIAQCAKAIRCSTGVLRGPKGPRPIAPRARRMLRPNSLVLGSRGDDRSVETGNRNRHRLRDSGVTTPRRSSHRCKADEHKEYRRPRNV